MRIFGFLFESLVERDLWIYIESLGGNLYHFRDNITGLEVSDGDYAAVEIKLGSNQIEEVTKNPLAFQVNKSKN